MTNSENLKCISYDWIESFKEFEEDLKMTFIQEAEGVSYVVLKTGRFSRHAEILWKLEDGALVDLNGEFHTRRINTLKYLTPHTKRDLRNRWMFDYIKKTRNEGIEGIKTAISAIKLMEGAAFNPRSPMNLALEKAWKDLTVRPRALDVTVIKNSLGEAWTKYDVECEVR